MSYSEKDGKVVLTMSRDDYDKLLIQLGAGALSSAHLRESLLFINRLLEGSPTFKPYNVEGLSR
jgi:hypothetical protein